MKQSQKLVSSCRVEGNGPDLKSNLVHFYWSTTAESTEAALERYSWEKVFWKYGVNLQENTHAKVRFQ